MQSENITNPEGRPDNGPVNGPVSGNDNAAILIAYGSNMSPTAHMAGREQASQAFAQVVKTLSGKGLIITKISRLWRSLAWPDPNDPPYVNAVMQIETHLQAAELLGLLHEIEYDSGRIRTGIPNAPRILDLDLIAYGRQVSNENGGLIIPHPRAADRAFVMGPLTDILPQWRHPVSQIAAADLYVAATVGRDAYPVDNDA